MVEKNAHNFGPFMMRLMKVNSISYAGLSKHLGIPRSSLHEYAHNKHRIPLESALTIANFFNVTIDEMLTNPGTVNNKSNYREGC